MRIDSSGNVGIGTASPNISAGASGSTVLTVSATTSGRNGLIELRGTRTSNGEVVSYLRTFNNSGATPLTDIQSIRGASDTVGQLAFFTSNTERMRLDSSGDLLVGQTTSSGRLTVRSAGSTSGTNAVAMLNSSGTGLFYIRGDGAFNTGGAAQSPYFNTSATAANLVVNSSGFLERSTSSARYKENIRDYDQSISIDALRPVFFNSKKEGDSKTYAGLIAEEVHDAGFTEFVEYNDDGEPDAVFYANMVALCIKEIQELKAEVAALKGA